MDPERTRCLGRMSPSERFPVGQLGDATRTPVACHTHTHTGTHTGTRPYRPSPTVLKGVWKILPMTVRALSGPAGKTPFLPQHVPSVTGHAPPAYTTCGFREAPRGNGVLAKQPPAPSDLRSPSRLRRPLAFLHPQLPAGWRGRGFLPIVMEGAAVTLVGRTNTPQAGGRVDLHLLFFGKPRTEPALRLEGEPRASPAGCCSPSCCLVLSPHLI